MKRILGILLGLLLIVGVGTGWATMACSNPSAGTVTSSSDKAIGTARAGVRLAQISYTTTTDTFTCVMNSMINGWILRVQTDPGITAPDSDYDITIKDANGQDVMGGALADRSATLTESTRPLSKGNYEAVETYGLHTIAATNTGSSKTAEILIYYLPF
ncbi:hypothetical protein LCGC14_0992340 [marine sediment metagenome]|uniref:Uncharacterized protein n=1 Tax=marine sediment metagenome TaxID=412755 RepID=A0A0F9N5J4_9ZZZZ